MTTITIQGMRLSYSLDVEPTQVLRVYSGRAHACMCGCAGRYWSPAVNAEYAGKNRGYALDEKDINDRQVAKILKTLATAERVEQDGKILHTTVGNRAYVAYLV